MYELNKSNTSSESLFHTLRLATGSFSVPGTVVPATEQTVWKKCAQDSNEAKAYRKLMDDAAAVIAPKFYKEVEHKGECKHKCFLRREGRSVLYVDSSSIGQ